MKKILALFAIVGAILILPAMPADAQTQKTCQGKPPFTVPAGKDLICSKTYAWRGPCNNTDFVTAITYQGYPAMPTWKLTPWETTDILIVGSELILTDSVHNSETSSNVWWAMIGNNTVPDSMLFLTGGERHRDKMFPSGSGMPFPSIANATADDYLDIHGACTTKPAPQLPTDPADNAHGFITIYYIIP